MIEFQQKDRYNFNDFMNIVAILRLPDGCPWDREQTHESIRKNFIEEVYEVCEAIDKGDSELLKEELGDVLLQVILHAQMEKEENRFDMDDVITGVCCKIIERHPHVFGEIKVDGSDEVKENWEAIKRRTKGHISHSQAVLDVPAALPSLMRSQKIQQRAARSGFDYPHIGWALEDLKKEIAELEQAMDNGETWNYEEEMGDILFSAVNISRILQKDAEECLTKACNKFINRFIEVEQMATEAGKSFTEMSIDEMNELWAAAKSKLKSITDFSVI